MQILHFASFQIPCSTVLIVFFLLPFFFAPCAHFLSKEGCLSLMGSSCWPSTPGARLFALLNNPWSGPSTEKWSKISLFCKRPCPHHWSMFTHVIAFGEQGGRNGWPTPSVSTFKWTRVRGGGGLGTQFCAFGSRKPAKVVKPQKNQLSSCCVWITGWWCDGTTRIQINMFFELRGLSRSTNKRWV